MQCDKKKEKERKHAHIDLETETEKTTTLIIQSIYYLPALLKTKTQSPHLE